MGCGCDDATLPAVFPQRYVFLVDIVTRAGASTDSRLVFDGDGGRLTVDRLRHRED
jgi:hypothetical protein